MNNKHNYNTWKYHQTRYNEVHRKINTITIRTYISYINADNKNIYLPNDIFKSLLEMIVSNDPESHLLLKGILESKNYRVSPAQLGILCTSNEYKEHIEQLIMWNFILPTDGVFTYISLSY